MTARGTTEAAKPVGSRWLWRALIISIPTHVAVFSILYFGAPFGQRELYLLPDAKPGRSSS